MSGAEILGALGMGAGIGTAMGVISDYVRMGITWAKWKSLGRSTALPMMADVMQQILDADKSPLSGLSTEGIMSSMFNFIDKTMDLGWVVNEQMANALFMHMIQQSIAYAIHQSHGGAVQTICNVFSGSTNVQGMAAAQLADAVDLIDTDSKTFLGAATGLNIPTLAFEYQKGANQRIDTVYKRIISQIDSFTDKWNNVVMSYYDHYMIMARTKLQESLEMKENIIAKGYTLLEKVANEHLVRIAEQIDTISGVNNWKKAQFTTADELIQICNRINVEREASVQNYNEYVTEIQEGIDSATNDWDSKITQALNDMQDCESRYAAMIKDILGTMFADVESFVNGLCEELDYTVESVCAYRNVDKVVSIEIGSSIGVTSRHISAAVSRLRWHRWIDLGSANVISEYQTPSSLPWEDAELIEVTPITTFDVDRLGRNRWIDVYASFIAEHTELTPLVPWYDAEVS